MGNLDGKEEKPHTHTTLNLLHVLLNDCVIIHVRGLHCKVVRFYRIQRAEARVSRSEWALKNIISQDHSGHKETGQPSPHDWMSPHMLRL